MNITRGMAKQLRKLLLITVEDLPDETAASLPSFVDVWAPDVEYKAGKRLTYDGTVYKVLQDHTSQSDWTPNIAASLYAKVLIPTDEDGEQTDIPEWEQPESTNGYMKGDRVKYNGHIYESLIDNNVWSPDAYPDGWKLVEE